MSSQTWGLVIGGLLPALLFGLSNIFAKAANAAGVGLGLYVICIGLSVVLVGGAIYVFQPDTGFSPKALVYTCCVGLAWATGTACIAYALVKHGAPISILVPLFNMNSLVSVVLGLWLFAEWRDVNTVKLLAGTVLIAVGGSLVATS
jgi:uncharacterized membrane protein